jgi:hypothetical protein
MAKSVAAVRSDPYRNFRFRVEIDGIVAAGFSQANCAQQPVRRYVFSPAKFEGGVMCGRGLRCKGKIGEAVRPVQSCVRPFSAVLDDRWP